VSGNHPGESAPDIGAHASLSASLADARRLPSAAPAGCGSHHDLQENFTQRTLFPCTNGRYRPPGPTGTVHDRLDHSRRLAEAAYLA